MILFIKGTPAEIDEYLYGDCEEINRIAEEDNPNIPIGDEDEDKDEISAQTKTDKSTPDKHASAEIDKRYKKVAQTLDTLLEYIEEVYKDIVTPYVSDKRTDEIQTNLWKLIGRYALSLAYYKDEVQTQQLLNKGKS